MGRIENPNLKNDYERACGWYGHFNKSEMALFSECTDRYAQKMLDTADIVREAMFQQLRRAGSSEGVENWSLRRSKLHIYFQTGARSDADGLALSNTFIPLTKSI